MERKFETGVLLHISSLPGRYGIGQIGQNAYNFIDFLSEAGFTYWEILPLNQTSFSNSPYQTLSAFGLNQYFIDYDLLVKDGLLNSRDFQGIKFFDDARKANFQKIFANSDKLLFRAYKRFNKNNIDFIKFKSNNFYLSYAMYMALKKKNDNKAWYDFRLEERYFNEDLQEEILSNNSEIVDYYLFLQFIFNKQWNALHEYAKRKNIKIIGEIPHFLDFDSASVFTNSEEFMLNKFNLMDVVAGFPPDEFTKFGQRWGEPLYDWNYMKSTHYKWWKKRIHQALDLFDYVKINHFSGFYKVYGIPFKEKSNKEGKFYFGPGLELFKEFKDAPILASDLGVYDKDVEKFVKSTGYTTLKTTLLSLFKTKKIYEKFLPSALDYNSFAYIGNHDNNVLRDRIEILSINEKETFVAKLINECKNLNIELEKNKLNSNRYLSIKVIETLLASKAHFTSLMMQDVLNEGKDSRMNTPGTYSDNNWSYRFLNSDFNGNLVRNIKSIIERYRPNK